MKIVFDGLIYSLQNQGGISRYFDELINGLAQDPDCDVTLLLRKDNPGKVFNKNVKIEIINSTIYTKNKFLKYLSVFIDGLKTKHFLRNRIDLSNSILHHSYYRYFKNIPYKQILTIHDLTNELFPTHFTYLLNKISIYNKKKSLLGADKVIAVSHQTREDLLKLYGIAEEKIKVIHHGVDSIFKKEESDKKKTSKPFFLFVGYRYTYKNFCFLLETLNSWPQKHKYKLICLGGDDFTEEEKVLIKKYNLSNNIEQIMVSNDTDLVHYYNNAVALIYPSLYEGFGLPILESIACGTPVICSDIPVFHEVGGDFPLFFSNNQVDLIRCLNEVTDDIYPSPASSIEWAKRFTWRKTVLETMAIYRKLLEK